LKTSADGNGQLIAICRVPVMYPAAGENPGQPKEQQDPARATANVAAPQKGKPAGSTCGRIGGGNRRPHILGRPVTSAGQRNATPIGVAFRASGPFWTEAARIYRGVYSKYTCQPWLLAVVSNLPNKRLTRATRRGQSALAAEQGSFAAQGYFLIRHPRRKLR